MKALDICTLISSGHVFLTAELSSFPCISLNFIIIWTENKKMMRNNKQIKELILRHPIDTIDMCKTAQAADVKNEYPSMV